MSSYGRKHFRQNHAGLRIEPLEQRALLSYAGVMAAESLRSNRSAIASLLASENGGGAVASGAQPMPTPTPRAQAQARFVAKLVGSYHTGYPQLTDQAFQIGVLASGGSNQSLHMNLNLIFFYPKDPTQPVKGVALMSARNVTSAGNAIGFTLQADAQQPGYHGLPTQFTWTVSGNSGATYSGASGSGTLTIQYHPSGHGPLNGFGAGNVSLDFQGSIYTTGVNNVLATVGNRA